MDVIIGIGYDNSTTDFYRQVRSIIDRFGVLNSEISGTASSERWGREESTWFAATFTPSDFSEAYERILAVGSANHQDAIAFTIGFTDVALCPAPNASAQTRYRDFL